MSLQKNVVANFAGSAWVAVMSLAFVPFYIRLLGAESYGIVGVFASLVGILAVLDLGLSQAMSREMARLSAGADNAARLSDTARTIEWVYWGVAAAVGLLIVVLSDFIAYRWLNPAQLSREDLRQALWVMALVIALRWPVALYTGGQVQVNILMAFVATGQGLGALAVLWFIAPTAQAFFWWQAFMALAQIVLLRTALWRALAPLTRPRFSRAVLDEIWRFAAGMSGISLLAMVLTQLDKVILSKVLPLADFGYYTFATTVAAVLFRLVGPVFTAYYPRLTGLAERGDEAELARTYHQASQLMAVVTLPAAFVLAFFARDILAIWTHNPVLVANAAAIVSIFAIGNAINGLMNLPYALQLAYGWTRLALYTNTVSVVLLIPAMYFATQRWGATGAAGVWVLLNAGYLTIGVHVMHRRLLTAGKWRWYAQDIGLPAAAAAAVCGLAWALMPPDAHAAVKLVVVGAALVLSTLAALAGASMLRTHSALRGWLAGGTP